jgi:pilus assembly protein CpaE
MTESPIKVFVTGSAEGLAEVREALVDHPVVQLVGTAADPARVAGKLAEANVDVVLHGVDGPHLPVAELEAIRAATPAPVVVLTSDRSGALLAEALVAGVFDVVLLPQPVDSVAFTVAKAHSHAHSRPAQEAAKQVAGTGAEGKVVTVFGPKGGTGKTTLVCNLAAVVARRHGKRVLVLDLDLQFGDAAIMFGLEPEKTIFDLVMARGELDSDALAGYVASHPSGADLLAAPMRPEDAELVTEERLATLFAVARASYDVIVVDTAPFFHGPVLATLDRTDHLLLMAALDVPGIKNVKLAGQTLDLLHFPPERRRLVLAGTGAKSALKPAEVERALDLKASWSTPHDKDVPASVNRGVPVAAESARGDYGKAVAAIADGLLGAPGKAAKQKSGKFKRS